MLKLWSCGHLGYVPSAGTLDLPQVEVLVRGEVATVTFRNPMKLYPQLQWAQEIQPSDPLVLSFDVTEHNVRELKNIVLDRQSSVGPCVVLVLCWTINCLVLHHQKYLCWTVGVLVLNHIVLMLC